MLRHVATRRLLVDNLYIVSRRSIAADTVYCKRFSGKDVFYVFMYKTHFGIFIVVDTNFKRPLKCGYRVVVTTMNHRINTDMWYV